jgi:hypothetical protein
MGSDQAASQSYLSSVWSRSGCHARARWNVRFFGKGRGSGTEIPSGVDLSAGRDICVHRLARPGSHFWPSKPRPPRAVNEMRPHAARRESHSATPAARHSQPRWAATVRRGHNRISSAAPVGGHAWLSGSSFEGPRARSLPALRAYGEVRAHRARVSQTPRRQPHSIRRRGYPRLALEFVPSTIHVVGTRRPLRAYCVVRAHIAPGKPSAATRPHLSCGQILAKHDAILLRLSRNRIDELSTNSAPAA